MVKHFDAHAYHNDPVGAFEALQALFRWDDRPRPFHWEKDVVSFYNTHWMLYAVASIVYLPLTFWLQSFMKSRRAVDVPAELLFCWDAFWSVFSGLCFFDLLALVADSEYGWHSRICTDDEFLGVMASRPEAQVAMRARFLFIIAKLAELGDTLFIVLKKRQLIVLHYWHHVTVLLFCWQIAYAQPEGGDGTYFALMNAFVHMVMYGYYALTAQFKSVRKVCGPAAHVPPRGLPRCRQPCPGYRHP
jgi:elongation of very long chain fatty acids protein 6